MAPVIEPVKIDLSAERIAVNPEQACGARLVAARPVQNAFDELLFELVDGLVKMNSVFHHLPHQRVQLILHHRTPRTGLIRSRKTRRHDLDEFVAR